MLYHSRKLTSPGKQCAPAAGTKVLTCCCDVRLHSPPSLKLLTASSLELWATEWVPTFTTNRRSGINPIPATVNDLDWNKTQTINNID